MPIEWIVTGMGAIIATLSGAVALLWRNHLAADARERKRSDALEKRVAELIGILKKAAPK